MEKKEKLEKAVKLYITPVSVVMNIDAGCQLLSGSVHGDHQSADDDDAYAKQYFLQLACLPPVYLSVALQRVQAVRMVVVKRRQNTWLFSRLKMPLYRQSPL